MHVEAVKNAFEYLHMTMNFVYHSLAKDGLKDLQSKLDEPPMQAFSYGLYTTLLPIVDSYLVSVTVSASAAREKMWTSLLKYRSTKRMTLWKELLVELDMPQLYHSDQWLVQVTARLITAFLVERELRRASSFAEKIFLMLDAPQTESTTGEEG